MVVEQVRNQVPNQVEGEDVGEDRSRSRKMRKGVVLMDELVGLASVMMVPRLKGPQKHVRGDPQRWKHCVMMRDENQLDNRLKSLTWSLVTLR